MAAPCSAEHFDVAIVGAGISGIGAAYRLQEMCPGKSFVVLEGRDELGGTWDFFKYPGLRSDSDMYSFSFPFHPWSKHKAIAEAPEILTYLHDVVDTYGLRKHIRFGHNISGADFSSSAGAWSLATSRGQFTANFLFMCTGYYAYDEGYRPEFVGKDEFHGQIAHPQTWAPEIDWAGKRVAVIGSGATAVTMIPVLARTAAHVTQVQRTPSYIANRPQQLRRTHIFSKLPYGFHLSRWSYILEGMFTYWLAKAYPELIKKELANRIKQRLENTSVSLQHWTPSYDPWDQRICACPDNDYFDAVGGGDVSVITGHIQSFTQTGLRMESGETVDADLVVTATGMNMSASPFDSIRATVDGEAPAMKDRLIYRGVMFDGIPNLAFSFGYTNASWTMRSDLSARYVCRLINDMEAKGHGTCVPCAESDVEVDRTPQLSSGYFARAFENQPKPGNKAPWTYAQNYLKDIWALNWSGSVTDSMRFGLRSSGGGPRARL